PASAPAYRPRRRRIEDRYPRRRRTHVAAKVRAASARPEAGGRPAVAAARCTAGPELGRGLAARRDRRRPGDERGELRARLRAEGRAMTVDRKSTRLNSSHVSISYA